MIKVTNTYLDKMANSPTVQTIIKKSFTAKTSYWLARVFDEFPRLTKIYLSERQKLIEKHARRYEKDGEEKKDGEVIKSWKKGDMVSNGQLIFLTDMAEFTKEENELTKVEIEIGINKIKFDLEKEPVCTIEEMAILLPLLEIKNDSDIDDSDEVVKE